jgi:hypothetical protein
MFAIIHVTTIVSFMLNFVMNIVALKLSKRCLLLDFATSFCILYYVSFQRSQKCCLPVIHIRFASQRNINKYNYMISVLHVICVRDNDCQMLQRVADWREHTSNCTAS